MISLVVHDVNSASVNGGATLFFTILMRVRFPVTTPSVCLIARCGEYRHAHWRKFQRFPARRCFGFPNITDLFADWFVKMQQVAAFEIREVSLRSAALIKRACAANVVSLSRPRAPL